MSSEICATLERANQLAYEKGLLMKGTRIECTWSVNCPGSSCPLSKEENFVHIGGIKSQEAHPVIPYKSFFRRLEKRLQLL